MLTTISPKIGNLLIAEPFLQDDNFKRSVILITHISDEGDLGYILNFASDFLIKDIFDDCPNAYFPVLFGGPVAIDSLNFVHSCPDKIPGGLPICENLYLGGDFDVMKSLIRNFSINEDEIRFFMGYTGWAPNQLKEEIESNTWMVSDKFNPAIVFDESETDLWKECVINMGQRFAHIANFPEDPQLN